MPDISVDAAVSLAYATRPDYQAALERVAAAEAARHSVADELLPSIRVDADYGDIGFTPSDSRATFAVTGAVVRADLQRRPHQGASARGRRRPPQPPRRSRRPEGLDLLRGAGRVSRSRRRPPRSWRSSGRTRDLAAQQLTQARDRFAAGVANNIEVVQAQDAVAAATEQFIAAQYGFDLAKGALVRGIGTSEDLLRQLLGGAR